MRPQHCSDPDWIRERPLSDPIFDSLFPSAEFPQGTDADRSESLISDPDIDQAPAGQ